MLHVLSMYFFSSCNNKCLLFKHGAVTVVLPASRNLGSGGDVASRTGGSGRFTGLCATLQSADLRAGRQCRAGQTVRRHRRPQWRGSQSGAGLGLCLKGTRVDRHSSYSQVAV